MKKGCFLLFALIFIVLQAYPVFADSTSPNDDTFTYSGQSNTNQNNNGIAVKNSPTRYGWLEFDIGSAPVSQATLNLYNTWASTGNQIISIRGAIYSFNEGTLTWASQPDTNSWSEIGSWTTSSGAKWYTADITTFYNNNLGKTITICLRPTSGSGDGPIFEDKENSKGSGMRPYVSYTVSALPPVIAPVSPNPNPANATYEYKLQIDLVQGTEPITWSVVNGPAGLVISQSGYITGWTPTMQQSGQSFTVEIQASNAYGSDTETWQVLVQTPPPPIIAQVTPDPDSAQVGVEYQKQLLLLQGALPVNWSVVQGPSGLSVDQNGMVRGWTPTSIQAGTTQNLEVMAANAYGSDTVSWQVYVPIPPAPEIAEVSPDPDSAMAAFEYRRKLTLIKGATPITWSVVNGPYGLTVDQDGNVSGWTPGVENIGQTFTLAVRAENTYGFDVESWQVKVVQAMNVVPKWGIHEVTLNGTGSPANPFTDTTLTATVTAPDGTIRVVDGFYDGDGSGGQSGNIYKLRFSPDQLGAWYWVTSSNNAGLNAKSGQFLCTASSDPGPIAADGRAFRYTDGNHVFLIANFLDAAAPTYQQYSHTLFSEEITEANRQGMITRQRDFHKANKINVYIANKGDYGNISTTPWVGNDSSNDKTRFDLSRWKMYERLIQQLKAEGMIVQLWFFADDSNFGSLTDAEIQRLIKYGMARLSPFVNTMFVFCLEWQEGFTNTRVRNYSNYAQEHNPWKRLWSVHGLTGNFSFPNDAWADFMNTQSGNSITPPPNNSHTITNRNLANKPLIVEEAGILSTNYDKRLRGNAWAVFCGGGAGIGTGSDLPRLKKFIEELNVPFQRMSPNNSISSSGFTLAEPAREYVTYVENGGSFTVQLPSGTYYAQWFSPRQADGNAGPIAIGTVSGGTRSFTTPNADDWVLHLRAIDIESPSVPTNVQAAALSPSVIDVNWTASTDAFGVTGYKIYRNGVMVGITTNTYFRDSHLNPGTTYSYSVSAYDAAGNTSAQSFPAAVAETLSAMRIDFIKSLSDNSVVGITGIPITAVYDNSFYVGETDRNAGIKVVPISMPSGLIVGTTPDIGGILLTVDGERCIKDAVVSLP